MTDRFKEAFDWCAKVRLFAHSLLGEDCFTTPLDTIEQALTLAEQSEAVRLEAEQLRKDLTRAQNDCLFFATYCLKDKSDSLLAEQAKHFIEKFNEKDN